MPQKPDIQNGNVDDWNQLAWEATQVLMGNENFLTKLYQSYLL